MNLFLIFQLCSLGKAPHKLKATSSHPSFVIEILVKGPSQVLVCTCT